MEGVQSRLSAERGSVVRAGRARALAPRPPSPHYPRAVKPHSMCSKCVRVMGEETAGVRSKTEARGG